jgi:hypothetical protein
MNFSNIDIKIKLNSKKKLEIFVSKQKELTKIIENISDLLPLFRPNIKIDKSFSNYYVLTGEDNLGIFAVLNTIIEEVADLFSNLNKAPNFYT